MDFLDNIKEKTIIICPSTIKNRILTEINNKGKLINIKIYSLEELKKLVYFDYDLNTILYLMDKYNYSYEIAKYYIENLYYVEDKKYNNEKLDNLVNLKKELIDNNLLIFNEMFKKSYINTQFIVFGYDYIDSFNKILLENFNYIEVKDIIQEKENEVYKFNTLEEEVLYVINKIVSLINENVDINNIYLLNVDDNYKDEIVRIFNMFNIPIDIDISSSLISSVIGKNIFNRLKESKSFEETVDYIDSLNLNNNHLYNKIINIFNKYVNLDYSFDSILKCIKYDFETTTIKNDILKKSVKIGDLYNSYYDDNDYVFLLGFNQGSIPQVFKDEDYINDNLKIILGLDTTNIINLERIEATKRNINRIKNITITYKKHYLKEEFYPSNLLIEDSFKEKVVNNLSTNYSDLYSRIKLAKMIDNLINYDEYNDELPLYNSSINDLRYMEYDNKYKQLDKNDIHKMINNSDKKTLLLSYSHIDEFFKCQFKYYISRILKLNKYDDSFDLFIGNLFHEVLSKIDNEDFDFDKEYDNYINDNNYIKDKNYTNKELFYINKFKKELKIVCDFVKEFHDNTKLSKILCEKTLNIDKSIEDLNILFTGKIDKAMYIEDGDKSLVSVIDYKTGNEEIKLDYLNEGIGLQLLMYLYLIEKDDKKTIKNPQFVGFYIQNVLKEIKSDSKKSYLEQKYSSLKLNGYSTNNRKFLEMFDPTYEKSKFIKSMSITVEDEFGKNSKLLDEDSMKNITKFIDKKVDIARDKIIDAQFTINPKYDEEENDSVGCNFCKYKDICFMKSENYVPIVKNKSFDFLKEGEIDA